MKIKGFQDTIDWYNANAQQYADNIASIQSTELIDKFVVVVGQGGRVLDAGCAAGRDCRLLKDRGLNVVGIDLSAQLLAIAKKNNPDIEFHQGNFLAMPFKDNTFDGIWAHASLLHLELIEEVAKAIKEFHRVLKSGGILHVFVKQQLGSKKTSVVTDKLTDHDRFFQWFTKEEIEKLLINNGFSIVTLGDNYPDPGKRTEVKWIYTLGKKNKVKRDSPNLLVKTVPRACAF